MKNHLLSLFLFLPVVFLAQTKVIINEVLYDTPLNEGCCADRYNGEFVSIYNYGYEAVDVSGWSLLSAGQGQSFVFPQGSIIQPQATFYVAYRNTQSIFFYQIYTKISNLMQTTGSFIITI